MIGEGTESFGPERITLSTTIARDVFLLFSSLSVLLLLFCKASTGLRRVLKYKNTVKYDVGIHSRSGIKSLNFFRLVEKPDSPLVCSQSIVLTRESDRPSGDILCRGEEKLQNRNYTHPAKKTASVTGAAVRLDVYAEGGTVTSIATRYLFVKSGVNARRTDVSASSSVHESGKHSAHIRSTEPTGIGIVWKQKI